MADCDEDAAGAAASASTADSAHTQHQGQSQGLPNHDQHVVDPAPASSADLEEGTSPDPPAFANTFAALAGTVSPPLRRRRPSSGSKRGHTEFDHSDGDLASGASSADEESHRSAWHRLEKQGHQLSAGTRGARAEKKSVQRVAPKNDSAFQTSEGDISIVVGSRRFVCDGKIFAKHPNTMLGKMFGDESGDHAPLARPNDSGDYVISHNSSFSDHCFKAILDFYREGKIRCPPHVSVAELHSACQFFLIPFTHEVVQTDNVGKLLHQLSNQGAEKQFDLFLEDVLTPAMARSASLGERECHIVCLSNEDLVEWDDELPPRLGEQYAQVVHSTSLLRFLKFYDNRVIAKTTLRTKGLKHVKIGIEGFPTFAEKIKREQDGTKYEVIYNYEQRPFIKLSWEIEDNKSRHVDFQTVKGSRNR